MTSLEQLPARIDRLESQILQFREEVRGEFSAVRAEMRAGDEETRRVLRDEIGEDHVMIVTALTEQFEQGRRESRVLFEEVLDRIARLQEGK